MSRIWWLASYPKSGNTWLRLIVAHLVSRRPVDINRLAFLGINAAARDSFDTSLGVRSADLLDWQIDALRPRVYEHWARHADRPLYCKVHDRYGTNAGSNPMFPGAVSRGAICMVRDPRAIAVSYAGHRGSGLDETIAVMDDPDHMLARSGRGLARQLPQKLGRWGDHVESWLAADLPVTMVRYEDALADPVATIAAIAATLGLACTPERAAEIAEATRFDTLQQQERANGFAERPRTAAVFFREGKADGWRASLTPDQADRIVRAHERVMIRLGYRI